MGPHSKWHSTTFIHDAVPTQITAVYISMMTCDPINLAWLWRDLNSHVFGNHEFLFTPLHRHIPISDPNYSAWGKLCCTHNCDWGYTSSPSSCCLLRSIISAHRWNSRQDQCCFPAMENYCNVLERHWRYSGWSYSTLGLNWSGRIRTPVYKETVKEVNRNEEMYILIMLIVRINTQYIPNNYHDYLWY